MSGSEGGELHHTHAAEASRFMRSMRHAFLRLAVATLAICVFVDARDTLAAGNTSNNTSRTTAQKTKANPNRKTLPKKNGSQDRSQKSENGSLKKKKPVPATWSAETIARERQICTQLLGRTDAIALPETSFRKGRCGAAAPVRLIAVGSQPQVVLSPPAIMTCRLAAAIHRWTTEHLQPLAKRHLNDQVIRIEVMSDYSCRNTYGRKTGNLSEHAFANALDIRGFSTAHGKVVRLLSSWGPTARQLTAEKARAEKLRRAQLEAQRAAEKNQALRAAERNNQSANAGRKKTAKQLVVTGTRSLLDVGDKLASAAKTAIAKTARRQVPMLPLSKRLSQQGYFLRAAHKAACQVFGTILGPEADHAHRNHFHVDMRQRRHGSYCR